MFNLNKDAVRSDADKLAEEANNTVDKVAGQIKSTANKVSDNIVNKTENTKDQAEALINSLRALMDDLKQTTNVDEIKQQINNKIADLKHVVTDEVSHAYSTSKQRAVDAVKEHPVSTLMVVAGVGLLLGYVLGSKQSSQ
ncbi:MAG: hypothetical protein B7X95_09920 [Methylophilaceae bacterium 17-44-8]|jgi:ElaB/YqjD/DUF883 family membrane-anchored ribosome-binding protein|nr:MAG: hypothetical protein B7Y48_04985 [Methylophilales bacterium 28-44-11]OZA04502.1 MAG: hypothetical protein B7X95_09920 [Methylophilaceae bacterium 17-44-8]